MPGKSDKEMWQDRVVASSQCAAARKIKSAQKRGQYGVDLPWSRTPALRQEAGRPVATLLRQEDDCPQMRVRIIARIARHHPDVLILSTKTKLQLRWGEGYRVIE